MLCTWGLTSATELQNALDRSVLRQGCCGLKGGALKSSVQVQTERERESSRVMLVYLFNACFGSGVIYVCPYRCLALSVRDESRGRTPSIPDFSSTLPSGSRRCHRPGVCIVAARGWRLFSLVLFWKSGTVRWRRSL